MAELITAAIALPALYLIGEFYWPAGLGFLRSPKTSAAGEVEAGPVPDSGKYDAALVTASAVIGELAARPEMSQAEKLSTVTYTILRTMGQMEKQRLPAREGS